ncbi:type I phosphoribosyltransferase [Simkania negevensis]|uniref:adenine phosphoribosyltransferase n=1 Tax=Simkania negevensis (strain ATCC VR-1471 / DSM 27360 / Z) TaxID=331113 RepID=F8L930_SIMNZ|nr:hypothetical protein [Simkania negevensis]CCB89345.1 hypothetical protein SNE_A14680 [Simkania negevensis Z]
MRRFPEETLSQQFELEYGTDCLEVEKNALQKGQRVLILDDLLATGGQRLQQVSLPNRQR